ncbi:hypothetical protein GCM10010261_62310 [Streptomyces pilosus]|uniref:hypothetical protein n=1 Tax=Streptomyces pilosus TaxID=28893 RepID=UPI0016724EF8|nr:hypothetical protein [Streptomyces pilosus]GGV68556.1 hypothetical protein GCM10010261_62310 [Streptomyces pilosus]
MRYEFRVHGPGPASAAEVFPEMEAATLGEDTVLYGAVIDEAHLFGLLARFRVLGVLVTEMRQVPSPIDGYRAPLID